MLRSMTGYGRGEASLGGLHAEIELSSVNRKQCEVRLNLGRNLVPLEARILEEVQKVVSRGYVAGTVSVSLSAGARGRSVKVDEGMAEAAVRELRRVGRRLGLRDDLGLRDLVMLPEILRLHVMEDDIETLWPVCRLALRRALQALVTMREREGVALRRDLQRRLVRLERIHAGVRKLAPTVKEQFRELLAARLKKAGVPVDLQDPAVLREMALFAEKSDIAEEITRLESHLRQGRELLVAKEPVGRTLDFLAQEMFREINTIGSKANHLEITRRVIDFKTELERVREQVQNVE